VHSGQFASNWSGKTNSGRASDAPGVEVRNDEYAQRADAHYRLFKTTNIWSFFKLDTRTGLIWQLHWGAEPSSRMITALNSKPLVSKAGERDGKFTLYRTTNIFNYLLLDQENGRTWQVHFDVTEAKDRVKYGIVEIQ
jgi:hypothetical protein